MGPVFKEWAHSWARRTIIQNAVRVINPRPVEEHAPSSFDSDGTTLAVEQVETARGASTRTVRANCLGHVGS
jgi:hypothetical protein